MSLSLFEPYRNKELWHEDHLTWAYLNLVRLVPMVLATFLDQVAAQQREQQVPSDEVVPALSQLTHQAVAVHSQIGEIPQLTGRVVSLVMTDEHWEATESAKPSDRRARFDGVLCFDPSWVFVIENKPRVGNIWEGQLQIPLPAGEPEMVLNKAVVCLVWKDVIQSLGSLVSRGLCRGVEAQLIEDFLAFTDSHFSYLNPYSTLSLCKGNDYLIRRRCATLLGALGLGEAVRDRGYEQYVRLPRGAADRVYLYPTGDGFLELVVYPGDNVEQARAFFEHVDQPAFVALEAQGWGLRPNLHFSFMGTHLQWSTSDLTADAYLTHWKTPAASFGQIATSDLPVRLQAFLASRLMTAEDVAEVERVFLQTRRTKANIIPGMKVAHRLPLAEAIALDDRGELQAKLQGLLATALATWKQPSRHQPAPALVP